ncbi:MAG: multi-sensor hybrid histidine kinase [Frankiales bacterium]|nr:multi-sensor hybrid histidine kinase [Frankiales bacterium]
MDLRPRRHVSGAAVVPLVLAAAAGAWFLLPRGVPRDAAVVLLNAAVVGALAAGARRSSASWPWRLLTAGQALNTAAWAVWLVVPPLTGHVSASPGLGDLLFLTSYVVSIVVVAALSRAGGADRSSVLDAAILGTSFGVVLWVTVASPQAHADGVSALARAVSVAYPVLDVLLLAAAAPLVLASSRTRRGLLLAGWVALQLAADVVYGRQVVAGTFAYGTAVFGIWLLSYALLAGAALHPDAVGVVKPSRTWRRLVLVAGVLPLPVLLVVRVSQQSSRQVAVVGVATLVVTLLAVARAAQGDDLGRQVERDLRRSLVRLAVGVVVLALVPLAGLTALAVTEARSTVDDEVARRLETAASTSAAHVQDQMGVLEELVAAYADRPVLVAAAATGGAGAMEVVARQLRELEGRSPSYLGAWFVDAAGTMRAFSPAQPTVIGRSFSQRDYYRAVVRLGRAHVSEAFTAALPGSPQVVAVSAPVRQDGRLLGVVALGYRLDALAAFVSRVADVQQASTTMTDARGTVLAGPSLAADRLVSQTGRPEVDAALAGRAGLVRPSDRETGTWSAYQPVPGLGWAVVADISAADAYAPVQRLTGRLVAAATLLGQVLLGGLLLQVGVERRRRLAEGRLAGREAEVSEILAEAGDAYLSLDRDGTVLRWNRRAEEVFGWTAEQARGRCAGDLVVPGSSAVLDLQGLAPWPAAGQGDRRVLERVLCRRDGSEFAAELTVWSTTGDGLLVLNLFVRDVTAQAEHAAALAAARDAALHASVLKSEFVANMSHEIRTPMNGVVGMTTLLLDTPLDPRQRGFVETLRGSADALLAVLNDVLDFSKIEAGKLDLEDADVALAPLLEDVVELLAASASVKGLEIVAVVDPAVPCRVRTDGHRLRQVLINLVGNAVKFTDRGEVVLEVSADGPVQEGCVPLRFAVRDTGAGIAPDRQAQLFEAFAQADTSTTRKHGGTGLGLTISRRLVALLGGELSLESEVGRGSVFSFVLPLPVVVGSAPEPATDLAGVRVLVADDSATNRTVLEHLLGRWSAEVVSVADADEALAALHEAARQGRPFRVALLDVRMPGGGGLAVAAAVDADDALRGVAVVLLSSADEVGEPVAPGVDARLTKPVRERHLRRTLLELLAGVPEAAVPGPRAPQLAGRVLVAEDGLVNQVVIVEMLAMLGVACDVAADGAQAVALLQQGGYDAVLMDCQMPVLDGYAATREIRALPAPLHRTPVIALTASALTTDRRLCEEAGMDDFLAKPLRVEELERALRRVLSPAPPARPAASLV